MSADNGIYILKTPKDNNEGFEYRVIHAQAIENIYWDDVNGYDYENPNPVILMDYFGNAPVLTEKEATQLVFKMEKEVLEDDFCPVLEYGINTITFPKPFSWYQEEAEKVK